MSTNDAAMPSPPPCSLDNSKLAHLQEDRRFRFTPVKTTRDVPRVWDRMPSTPFLSRPRSRKVWKRFRSSFNSMKALQRLVATERECVDEVPNLTEINTSRNVTSVRGVKRRCFSLEDADGTASRGRSFLETKWESNIIIGRRRKIPTNHGLVDEPEPMTVENLQSSEAQDEISDDEIASDTSTLVAQTSVEQDESRAATTALAPLVAYPRLLHGQSTDAPSETDETVADIKETTDILSPQIDQQDSPLRHDCENTDPTAPVTTTTDPEDAALDATMTDERQAGQLEESPNTENTDENVVADGTPAAAAPAAAPVQDLTAEQESTLVRSALRSSLDGEDAALINNFLSKAKAKREAKAAALVTPETKEKEEAITSPPAEIEVPEMPTPPASRRALEVLDANSPSPQKFQCSPIKGSVKDVNENDEPLPASPRRSTRNSTSKQPRTTTGAVRNTFSLRRAKGTEFVFLQRSEAQELALATRRNTRSNKGESILPKYTLQKLVQPSSEPEQVGTDDNKPTRKPGRPAAAKKRVSWNEQLVEYEGEQQDNGATKHRDDVSDRGDRSPGRKSEKGKKTSRRITRSQGSPESGDDGASTASTTAPATATPRTRRVRRLGTPKSSTTAAVASLESSPSSSLSPSPEKRKKLTPQSPRTTLLGSSTSKKVTSSRNSTSKSSESSSSGRSASIFQTHAGFTPIPRRIRSRG
ncbi:uncharacterized protein KD926_011325 [Aspergillus affinis]|uniref:uncharacterized protein n=1 Tax=Aspergillus affinis TaxID=1070780 RepID=UPI0022FF0BF4|nr:uncharacterized protein KD926_011325 [Aspergillus affinis]KAI9038087.1 hypothetical protein KD926_011325 [Aspergillus affinis]